VHIVSTVYSIEQCTFSVFLFSFILYLSPFYLPLCYAYSSNLQNVISHTNFQKHWLKVKNNGKVHPCTGTETLYRPYGPYGE